MKRNLKTISLLLAVVMVLGLGLAACGKKAEPKNAAYVTVTNAGELAVGKDGTQLAAVAIEVPEAGTTVGEVIKALHKAYAKGGEADYATSQGQYGEQIDKLWGVENGGAYGYYINGAMAMGLTDPVKSGDTVDVFVYKDAAAYSDAYTRTTLVKAEGGEAVVKVEFISGFDANYAPIFKELAGAKIYQVDGKKLTDTGVATGADGTATIKLKSGSYILAAVGTDGTYTISAVRATVK